MKKIVLCFLIATICNLAKGQSLVYDWHTTVNSDMPGSSSANGVCAQGLNSYTIGTVSKNVYFANSGNSTLYRKTNNNSKDILITKQKDTILWHHIIGGTDDETGNDIATDLQGNLYCVGTYKGSVDFDPSSNVSVLTATGGTDIFILKLDTLGNFIWAKTIGGIGDDVANKIRVNNNGEIIIAGSFENTADFDPGAGVINKATNGAKDLFILSISNSGTYNWLNVIGGSGNDEAQALFLKNNAIYCGGYYEQTVDFDYGPGLIGGNAVGGADAFVVKLDSTGDFISHFTIEGTNNENVSGITIDSLNNTIVVGTFEGTIDVDPSLLTTTNLTSNGNKDAFVAKYASTGTLTFGFRIGNTLNTEAKDVITMPGNKIVVGGHYELGTDFNPGSANNVLTYSGGFVAYYSASGTYDWAGRLTPFLSDGNAVYDGSINALCRSGANAYAAGAAAADRTNGSFLGYRTGKVNYLGNNLPVNGFVAAEVAPIENVKFMGTDSLGNAYSSGTFSYSTDLDPSANVDVKGDAATANSFIQKLDANGNYVYSLHFEHLKIDDMHVDASGNQFIVGRYTGTVDVDPSTNLSTLTALPGRTNGFLAKYNNAGNLVFVKNFENYAVGIFQFYKITSDYSGNIFTCGSYAKLDFDPAAAVDTSLSAVSNYGFVAKYDALGNLIWVKASGGSPYVLEIDYNNDLVYSGTIPSGSTGIDFDAGTGVFNLATQSGFATSYLCKWTNNGQFVFANGWNSNLFITNHFNVISHVAFDSSNNIFMLSGSSNLQDIDPGTNTIVPTLGSQFVIKMNGSGSYVWHKEFPPDEINIQDYNRRIAVDKNRNIIFTRTFFSQYDCDPSTTNAFYVNGISSYGFVMLDSLGNFVVAKEIDSSTANMPINDMVLTRNNDLYACGIFSKNVDFSLNQGSAWQNAGPSYDCFVLKLNPCNNAVNSILPTSLCGAGSINGTNISQNGNYSFTYPSSSNCDSNVTYQVTIISTPPSTMSVVNCGPYTFNGNTYANSGTFVDTLSSSQGCDSVVTLSLTVKPTSSNTLALSNCDAVVYNQQTFTSTGTYYDTLVNGVGCDSILQLNITVNSTPSAGYTINGNTLVANSASSIYQWIQCNPLTIIHTAISSAYSPTTAGEYAIIQGNGDCRDTSACSLFIPLGLANNGAAEGISILPNPSSNQVSIKSTDAIAVFGIYTSIGTRAKANIKSQSQREVVLDVSALANGIYFAIVNHKAVKFEVRH
ncbi:MAG: hypothetical protein RL660_1716 [Bacteroidota bacterium]|jgi:hypothetical protein